MEDITSKQGENHVTSTQFRAILAAVLGSGSYIADQDDQLEPELAANNILNIHSGVLIHHGSVRRVPPGTYDQVAYLNGTQAMQRIDLVVVRYTKRGGIETSEWVVIQGTPAESDPEVPAHTEGNMQNGDLVDDCPVFELHFDGLNVTEVKVLLEVAPNIQELKEELSELNSELENVEATLDATNNTVSGLKNTFSRFTTVGSSGYIKMPNGLNMCYGYCLANTLTADSGSGGYATTITLPITLRSPLVVMVTPVFVSGFPRCSAYAISTSKIKLMCDVNASGCALHWIAIG